MELPELPTTTSALMRFWLQPRKYVLMVGRLVPEKRHADLITAFKQARLDGWKLVLVGDSDHATDYARAIREVAADSTDVLIAGEELYAHAAAFVLPSSHEGLPIALMEALGYGIPIIASDMAANLEIGLDRHCYFRVGDIKALTTKLRSVSDLSRARAAIDNTRRCRQTKQTWQSAAACTISLYCNAAKPRRRAFTRYITGQTKRNTQIAAESSIFPSTPLKTLERSVD
jgi:glycosyltransferase involved in cell wall biosynthesis